MEEIRAIIVDDELEGINSLEIILKTHCPEVVIVATFQSSVEALKAIKKTPIDLLFLDIQMPQINGLELVELLGTNKYNVIYTTAHDEYVLQALRLSALDYLKKPIETEELIKAVSRVKSSGETLQEQIKKTLEQMEQSNKIPFDAPFGIKVGNAIQFVKLSDICYCQSDGNFTQIYLTNGKNIYCSSALKILERRLPKLYFYRVHREYIINLHHIKEYNKSEGGFVKMLGTSPIIPIARSRNVEFAEVLGRL